MLHLYQSNRLELLFEALLHVLGQGSADPLRAETVVVHNPGLGQWLTLRLAERRKIAANLIFPLPAAFIHHVLAQQLALPPEDPPGGDLYARPVLLWRIYSLLPALYVESGDTQLTGYLHDDPEGRRRLQLADRISDLFDQYQVYRPDLLDSWEQDQADHWQARLWRWLSAHDEPHRGRLLQDFRALDQNEGLRIELLPEQICLFGISTLAPVYLEMLHRLAAHIPVHLFHLSPCRQYWEDIVAAREITRRQASALRGGGTPPSGFLESGNPLLASLGGAARAFFSQLMTCDAIEHDLYQDPGTDCLLHSLQQEILDLKDPAGERNGLPVAPTDRSVQFHICHSTQREIEVLHDRLLDLLAAYPQLTPGEILVMAPDIERYVPAVKGVFAAASGSCFIPWSLADRGHLAGEGLQQSFQLLLDLLDGRMSGPDTFALLSHPAVARRLGFSQTDLEGIRDWIRTSSIRWGLDRKHQQEFVAQASGSHSWHFGLDRLLLGSMVAKDVDLCCAVAPCVVTGDQEAILLGRLAEVVGRLEEIRLKFGQPHTIPSWCALLRQVVDAFFEPGDNMEETEALRSLDRLFGDLLHHATLAGMEETISFPLLREHFLELCARPGSGQPFLSGKVTFCNMVPLRTIPFGVICLVGMDDASFPRRQVPLQFDLMAAAPRLGDRNRREDDHLLFLETILAARKALLISWVGRDQQSNAKRPPAVAVAELRDAIDRRCKGASIAATLTVEHPLQPFSIRCYTPDSLSHSYNPSWMPDPGARAQGPLLDEPLPASETCAINVQDLLAFWSHPVRFFLQRSLGLAVNENEDSLEADEPLALDSLQRYALKNELLSDLLSQPDQEEGPWSGERFLQMQRAGGVLPAGGLGSAPLTEIMDQCRFMADRVRPLLGPACPPVTVDLRIGACHVHGQLDQLFPAGIINFRPARIKAGDLLRLWLRHLLLNLVAPSGCGLVSRHFSPLETSLLEPLDDAEDALTPFLYWFQEGHRQPLHFFPETSLAWAKATPDKRLARARAVWSGGFDHPGEGDDPLYHLALRHTDPLDHEFENLAELWLTPLRHLHGSKEA